MKKIFSNRFIILGILSLIFLGLVEIIDTLYISSEYLPSPSGLIIFFLNSGSVLCIFGILIALCVSLIYNSVIYLIGDFSRYYAYLYKIAIIVFVVIIGGIFSAIIFVLFPPEKFGSNISAFFYAFNYLIHLCVWTMVGGIISFYMPGDYKEILNNNKYKIFFIIATLAGYGFIYFFATRLINWIVAPFSPNYYSFLISCNYFILWLLAIFLFYNFLCNVTKKICFVIWLIFPVLLGINIYLANSSNVVILEARNFLYEKTGLIRKSDIFINHILKLNYFFSSKLDNEVRNSKTLLPRQRKKYFKIQGLKNYNVILITSEALRGAILDDMELLPSVKKFINNKFNIFPNSYCTAPSTGISLPAIFMGRYPSTYKKMLPQNISRNFIYNILRNKNYSIFNLNHIKGIQIYTPQIKSKRANDDFNKLKLTRFHHPLTDEEISTLTIEIFKENMQILKKGKFFYWTHYTSPHIVPFKNGFNLEFVKNIFNKNIKEMDEIYYRRVHNIYKKALNYTDKHLYRLLSFIESSGLLNNTIIIISTDHGESLYDHGRQLWGYGGLSHGGDVFFNEKINIPIFLYYPGIKPEIIKEVASSIDIVPTILDILSLPTPEKLEGISLRTLANKKNKRQYVFTEINRGGFVRASVNSKNWKLIYDIKYNNFELYNLKKDPYEKHNAIVKNKDKFKFYKKILFSWLKNHDVKAPQPASYRAEGLGVGKLY